MGCQRILKSFHVSALIYLVAVTYISVFINISGTVSATKLKEALLSHSSKLTQVDEALSNIIQPTKTVTIDQTEEAANSVAEDTANSVAEDAANSVAEDAANSITEDTIDSVAEETANSVVEETANNVAEETANNVAEETANSVAEEIANTVAEEIANSVTAETITFPTLESTESGEITKNLRNEVQTIETSQKIKAEILKIKKWFFILIHKVFILMKRAYFYVMNFIRPKKLKTEDVFNHKSKYTDYLKKSEVQESLSNYSEELKSVGMNLLTGTFVAKISNGVAEVTIDNETSLCSVTALNCAYLLRSSYIKLLDEKTIIQLLKAFLDALQTIDNKPDVDALIKKHINFKLV